jgi:hypothetical protein
MVRKQRGEPKKKYVKKVWWKIREYAEHTSGHVTDVTAGSSSSDTTLSVLIYY